MIVTMITVLLLLWSTVGWQADSSQGKEATVLLLPPVNFTIKITGLAKVLLHWEPNPDQEPKNYHLAYRVKINHPQEDDYEIEETESTYTAILHTGFSADVQTIFYNGGHYLESKWASADLQAPPGSLGTSVTNLSCGINTLPNNFVSLYCTWEVGEDAPEDTQYFFFYRYGEYTEECQEYSKDIWRRNIDCWFSRTHIYSKGQLKLAVHVNGSSRHAIIKPYDQLFALHAIDQVNPPVNITAMIERDYLSLQWEKPVSAFPSHCFVYEVNNYNLKTGSEQKATIEANTLSLVIDATCKYSVKIRATVHSSCRSEGLWSKWSEPIYIGKDEQWIPGEWLLSLLSGVILLVLALICRLCHLWTKLFPPVPAPNSNMEDLFLNNIYEKACTSETETEVLSFVEDPGSDIIEDSVF
ncbi:interleukin-5 receptor subunit alpha isoform X1 [Ornithorhynchus anatinus]|uniref:Interleukin 5 receptor subunit alpha n=1 Tax=Ornithorhynchus anatinus TaxID=9258 RepID=F7AGM5_ORNAN|nr:interleukin-5 receptor subunit alpha isoform X1 [Ornithorhynchus anatinus]